MSVVTYLVPRIVQYLNYATVHWCWTTFLYLTSILTLQINYLLGICLKTVLTIQIQIVCTYLYIIF